MPAYDPDDSTRNSPSWWNTIGGEGPKPYATAAWAYTQVVVEEEEACSNGLEIVGTEAEQALETETLDLIGEDNFACDNDEVPWWETIGNEGPKPYAAAAWSYTQVVIEEDVACSNGLEIIGAENEQELETETFDLIGENNSSCDEETPWWETIGNEGPKPYATIAWTYHQDVSFVLEFVAVFFAYDEEYYPRLGGQGVILDSGYFGQVGQEIYDSAFYLGNERGIPMKRKLARVLVYDQRADSPGILPNIPQPLGILATDPNFGDPLETDPTGDEIGAEMNNVYWASINGDDGPEESLDIAGDGDVDGILIEAVRISTAYDDRPPGTLLGSVSYELFGTTVTITDWEHLNWQDDTPVYKAVKVILNELPGCVAEIKVLDPPHAFWTSLGFRPNFKGDQYLHLYTA